MNEAGLGYPHKIVTCCYCGTRAALVLRGKTRHELSCSSCGAPLHDLKMLPKHRTGRREPVDARRPRPAHVDRQPKPAKPPRRRKRFVKKLFEEAFDLLEDIFD